MKGFLYTAGGILLLLGLMARPAQAAPLYKGHLECGNPEASGKASINKHGDLKIRVDGLDPDTTYSCEVICACELPDNISEPRAGDHIFEAECDSDHKGRIRFKEKGAVAGESCDCPAIEVEEQEGPLEALICRSGFDLTPAP